MPSTSRGRDAATLLAVIVAIVLAFAWLRSSDGGAPAVPAGLSVAPAPLASEGPAAPGGAASPATSNEGAGAGGGRAVARKPKRRHAAGSAKRGHADRAAAPPVKPVADARGRAGTDRQGVPATVPTPPARSGGRLGQSGGDGKSIPPEFALD
jgi:hypothetical protein